MLNEVRTVCFDTELSIEAYNFKGIMQKFPNHFHDYYVIGFIENGKRYLSCKNKQYIIETGDLIVFNPGDIHTCEQIDDRTLDYRCINVKKDVMKKITFEITGKEYLPNFMEFVLFRNELTSSLKELHLMIMDEEKNLKKDELFLFIMEQLIREYSNPVSEMTIQEASAEIKTVCDYLENNYMENITLNQLSNLTGLSKYYLLHSFTKQKGISPYNYLQTIRIGKAKKMLEQGVAPIDVAFKTGFTDQSHFTNFFKKLIGLTPKQYMNIFINRCRSKENE
ncbi:AraC family transcriptional regulator [Clostridium beijerinckii]|jgi:AraC-type DNA-binding domain-containing proteins|uniref:AraC family transcriptional regulator n=1 Tax=Clostridium beijerinckii TaxID=1520 RepID=A0AB74VBC5_CLOBE|nr:AraC family transcriptional regulator [Clostridium beijerinckii]NRZ27959.1 AraC-like DNA-binding protein [Clostridium beijerinckii]NYB96263.1 AraC-like DNA-binding protein [Clostridium beijerinckii]OOM22415.1 HTH-type transcriptional activator RhaS [Clostridium beijerinckii]QUN33719.1 AraC family transcriptional regulator [Clostridium beijerinckii]SQB01529.1 AraC family transcriptional regulator [Clostridium beijerinckii]